MAATILIIGCVDGGCAPRWRSLQSLLRRSPTTSHTISPIASARGQTRIARLAATLTARSHIPVRHWLPLRRMDPLAHAIPDYGETPNLEQADSLPLAAPSLRPSPTELEFARAFTGKRLILRDRIPFRALAPQVRMSAIVFGAMTIIVFLFDLLQANGHRDPTRLLSLSTALALVGALALGVALGVFTTVVSYRDDISPTVAATNDGLALLKFNELPRQRVAWEDIRAWAILAPAPGEADPAGCVIWTEEQTLEWREPPDAQLAGRGIQGDRHKAYRAAARQLHALIAARTGLPLRAIPPRPSA